MMCVNKGVFPALDRPGYLPGYRVLGTLFKTSFRTSCWQPRDIPACLLPIKVRSWYEDNIADRQKDTVTTIWLRDWFLLRGVITDKKPTGIYRRYTNVCWRALRSPCLWLEPKEETCSIRLFIDYCWALLTDVGYIVVAKLRHRSWWWPAFERT